MRSSSHAHNRWSATSHSERMACRERKREREREREREGGGGGEREGGGGRKREFLNIKHDHHRI